jgi:NADH-quinone oxidoreductase subunit I
VMHISDLNYKFATMTDAQAEEKRAELEKQQVERQAAKLAALQKMEEDKK